MVPDLSNSTLRIVMERTGLNLDELLSERAKSKVTIQQTLAQIESDEDFANRKFMPDILRQDKRSVLDSVQLLRDQKSRLIQLEGYKEFSKEEILDEGFFGSTWNSISGKNSRRVEFLKSAGRILNSNFGSVQYLQNAEKELDLNIRTFEDSIQAIDTRYSRLEYKIKEHANLSNFLESFDQDSLNKAREVVAGFFGRCQDLVTLRNQFQGTLKINITTLHAQNQKIEVFTSQIQRLKKEQNEIESVKNKISGVVSKWRRSSKSYVNGDKTKWLVDAPASRAKRLARLTSSSRTIYHSSYGYNDYMLYDTYLDVNPFMPVWYVGIDAYPDNVPNSMLQEFIPDYSPDTSYDIPGQEIQEETYDLDSDLEDSNDAFDAFAEDAQEQDNTSNDNEDSDDADVSDES
jgi:prefoldin subunit 5